MSPYRSASALALWAIYATAASAQELPSVLPIDAQEVRAIAVNPALGAFSGEYLEIGARESFLGITSSNFGLSSGFATYAFSDVLRGASLRATHFSSRKLDRTRIGAGYGFSPAPWLALGVSADLIDLGYRDLDLVDPDDPLFAGGRSRAGLGIGVGVALRNSSGFAAGASIEDLNRPDLSLDRNASTPSAARLHAALGFPLAGTRVALGARDIEIGSSGSRGLSGAALEIGLGAWLSPWAGARAFGGNRGIGLEGRIALPFGMELRYRAEEPLGDLAGFSYGSHQITLVGLSDRPIRVPRMRPPPPPPAIGPLPRAPQRDAHSRLLFITPSTDIVTIAEISITRHVDEDVRRDRLPTLSPFLRGTLDDLLALRFPAHDFVHLRVNDPLAPLHGAYEPAYVRTLGDLSRLLATDGRFSAAIVASGGSDLRAGSLWSTLTGTGAVFTDRLPILAPSGARAAGLPPAATLPPSEDLTQVQPRSITVEIHGIAMERFDGPRALVFRDRSGAEVHRVEAKGPPKAITWDWRTDDLALISPGRYTFRLEWTDAEGRRLESGRHHLTVAKRRQHVDISVSADPRLAAEPADRIVLFVGGGEPREADSKREP